MKNRSKMAVFTLLYMMMSLSSAQLVGEAQRCSREGAHVDVSPMLHKYQHCLTCFCKNSFVQCRPPTNCPLVDDCYRLKQKASKACCDQCLGCRHGDKDIEHGVTWTDGCTRHECNAGVLTTSITQCQTPCADPQPPTNGTCCPTCSGCWMDGKRVDAGETVTSRLDPCVKCQCLNGSLHCSKESCPVLSCPMSTIHHSSGSCCPTCEKTGTRRGHYDVPGKHCFVSNVFFRDGSTKQLDDCTTCSCSKRFLTCQKKTCPPLQCPKEYIITKPGQCCPECDRPLHTQVCMNQGVLREHGETWRLQKCSICTCTDGQVMCHAELCEYQTKSCPSGYILEENDSQCCPTCVKEKPGVCMTFGDPHYRTFDNYVFNFQGECRYDLAYDCKGKKFSVRVINDARRSSYFSWTRRLSVKINTGDAKYKISLGQKLRTKVNRKRVKIPYQVDGLSITRHGYAIEVASPLGLKLLWDGATYVDLQLDAQWRNRTCGLCGNYNNVTEDDKRMKNGKLASTDEDMAQSWLAGKPQACSRRLRRLQKEKEDSGVGPVRTQRLTCLVSRDETISRCDALKNDTFKSCHSVIDVEDFYKSCILDLCECPPSRMCECDSLTAYTRACQRVGIEIGDWRAISQCGGFECPRGSMYLTCAPDCKATCRNPSPNPDCHMRPCKEGCYCPPMTVLHKGACILPEKCRKGKKKHKRFKKF